MSGSADATLTADFTVPSGEVWELLAAAGNNDTTGAFEVRIIVQPSGSGTGIPLEREISATATIPIMWSAGTTILLYPGDLLRITVSDPGIGDTKTAQVMFRRYFFES